MNKLYHYLVKFVRAIDGDTIVVDIDLGFDIWARNQIVRLYGINAPEIHGDSKEAGFLAKQFTHDWMIVAPDGYWIWSRKYDEREKYGRVLATVMRGEEAESLNDALLRNKLAVANLY